MPKKYENNCNFEKYGKFPLKFKVFVFHLKPQNFYTKYNFLIACIWYTAHFVTFSISTQSSEKLNQIGFNFPPPDSSFQFTYSSMVAASRLQACRLAVVKPLPGGVSIACSGLTITSLLQVVNSLDANCCQGFLSTSSMKVVSTSGSKYGVAWSHIFAASAFDATFGDKFCSLKTR